MIVQIDLEPIAVNFLSEIGELEKSEPEKVLQVLINGFIYDRLFEEGNYLEKPESEIYFNKAKEFFDSW